MYMRVENTSSFRTVKMMAALAATCLVSTAYSGIGEVRPSHRFGEQRAPSNANWCNTSRNEDGDTGDLFVYVQDDPAVCFSTKYITRATSGQENLIAELRSWAIMSEDWDGEGASAPIRSSLLAASDFVCLLTRANTMPEPMLHASGRAGLVWTDGVNYAELEFLPKGEIVYYVTGTTGKHKGVVEFDGRAIPAPILPLIPA